MTTRNSLSLAALLLAVAGAVGWFAWRALSGSGDAQEDPAPAAASTEAARPLDPRYEEALVRLKEADVADEAVRTAKARESMRLLHEVEQAGSESPVLVPFFRGIAAVMADDERAARAALDRLTANSPYGPRDAHVFYLKAKVTLAFEREQAERAVRLLRTLRTQSPKFLPEIVSRALYDGLRAVAERLVNRKDADGGVAALSEALDLVRGDPVRAIEIRRDLARTLGRANRWIEARDEWAWLVETLHGADPVDRFGLANAHAAQSQYAPAIEQFTAVLAVLESGRLPPTAAKILGEARLRRGNCYRLLARLDEAKADLERYLAENPEDGRGHYWVGILRLDAFDDAQGAVVEMEKAHRLLPWCDDPIRTLAAIYEVHIPDPAKAKAYRDELDSGAAERQKARDRRIKERPDDSFICH